MAPAWLTSKAAVDLTKEWAFLTEIMSGFSRLLPISIPTGWPLTGCAASMQPFAKFIFFDTCLKLSLVHKFWINAGVYLCLYLNRHNVEDLPKLFARCLQN